MFGAKITSVLMTLLFVTHNYCMGDLRDELVGGIDQYQSIFQNQIASAEGSVTALVSVSGKSGGPSGQFNVTGKLHITFDPKRYRVSVPILIPWQNKVIKVEDTEGYDGSTMISLFASQGVKYSATKSCRSDSYYIDSFNCRGRGIVSRASYICGLMVASSDFGRGSFLEPDDSYLKRFIREADEIKVVDGGYIVLKKVVNKLNQIELRSQPVLHCVAWTQGIAKTTFKYAQMDGRWLPIETSRLVIEQLKDGTPSVASRELCTINKWQFAPIESRSNASFLPNIDGAQKLNDVCARESAGAKAPSQQLAEKPPEASQIPWTMMVIAFFMVIVAFYVHWKWKHAKS